MTFKTTSIKRIVPVFGIDKNDWVRRCNIAFTQVKNIDGEEIFVGHEQHVYSLQEKLEDLCDIYHYVVQNDDYYGVIYCRQPISKEWLIVGLFNFEQTPIINQNDSVLEWHTPSVYNCEFPDKSSALKEIFLKFGIKTNYRIDYSHQPKEKIDYFGHHMALESDLSQIPILLRNMYALLGIYSCIASLITGEAFYTQFVYYNVILCIFYLWHYLAHERLTGPMHEVHKQHHFHIFPPKRFYATLTNVSDLFGSQNPTLFSLMNPIYSTNFTFAHEGPLYIMFSLSIITAKLLFNVNYGTIVFFTIMAIVMGVVGSALHSSFHIRGFSYECYEWYLQLRTYHYIHHLGDCKHNYSIMNLFVDAFFGSMRFKDPVLRKKIS